MIATGSGLNDLAVVGQVLVASYHAPFCGYSIQVLRSYNHKGFYPKKGYCESLQVLGQRVMNACLKPGPGIASLA